jgi:hypothetical protein
MVQAASLAFSLLALVLLNVSPAYAVATVPEPVSATLIGTAIAALGIRAYRNRNRNR